ncbi:MAG: DUF1385 domain-containing protein, partial [Chloroflexota bacterium]|nr:DUF1385 domain-containing protein [Chloroflexota bacterium]
MAQSLPPGVRVGGSALPDGVMMLTPLAAAIAREAADGTLKVEAFPLPTRKQHPLEKLPFVRILPKLVGQMSLVVRGWKPGTRKQVPYPILGVAIGIGLISTGLNASLSRLPTIPHAVGASLLQLFLFFGIIGATRAIPRFGRIWRFHGGEHQAIATYEAEMELTAENAGTRTLYHPRCGTNLATLALLLMVPGMIVGTLVAGAVGYIITIAVPLPAMCVAFEIVMLGQKRLPAVLWPGLAFQRLTVARPGPRESAAGIAALQAALTEHAK